MLNNEKFKTIQKAWIIVTSCMLIFFFAYKIADAQTITEIIDATGDGLGNTLVQGDRIAVDGAGNVYVTGRSSDNVFKITPGGFISEIIDAIGDDAGNTLDWPSGLAVDGFGNVYVSSRFGDCVFKITTTGTITTIIDATGDGTGNILDFPHGIAVDDVGNVYVAGNESDNVFKITPTGSIAEIIDHTSGGPFKYLTAPIEVAVDGLGNVFVTSSIIGTRNVHKITPGGVVTVIIDINGDGTGNTFDSPHGIAVDSSNNVYVSGINSHNVFKITPAGVITQIMDASGDGAGNTFSYPFYLAADEAGNVFVTGAGSTNAFKIGFDGTISEIINASGDGAGNALGWPLGITIDGSNNVFIAGLNTSNAFRIGPFSPPTGTISGTVLVNNYGLENVIVKLLDEFGLPVNGFDDVYTNANGEYSFVDVAVGDYQVMIVEPLGYIVDLNPKPAVVIANETTTVDFLLTEVVLLNNARSKGYWKHQFDVYVKGRGNAQESEQDLIDYIDLVHQHYTLYYDIFTDVNTFEEWQAILSLKGNHPTADRAKQHLSALILNMVSNKIGQYTLVTEDGRDVGDVIQYCSDMILDGDESNDELAKDLAESVNNQQTIAAGIVPEGDLLFKTGQGNALDITTYELFDSYPNPFNPSTKIVYQIPEKGNVTIKIYDMLGKEIRTLVNGNKEEGRYEVEFTAGYLASGVYIYQLRINDFISTKKMVLMK